MFEGAGLQVHTYPYYDERTSGLRFEAMREALAKLPARSIVLLHACCHNPTGVDRLTRAQWDALIPVLRERGLIPYLDLAYQGFGDGIEADAYAARRPRRGRRVLLHRQLVLQEHERVRRALRRAVGRLPRCGAGRARARAAQVHGAAQLQQPADPRRPDRRDDP